MLSDTEFLDYITFDTCERIENKYLKWYKRPDRHRYLHWWSKLNTDMIFWSELRFRKYGGFWCPYFFWERKFW